MADNDVADVVYGCKGKCFEPELGKQLPKLGKKHRKYDFTFHNSSTSTKLVLHCIVDRVVDKEGKQHLEPIEPFDRVIEVDPGKTKVIKVKNCGIPAEGHATGQFIPDYPCDHRGERGHTDWHIDC